MKIKIKQQIEKEVEVEIHFPYYLEHGWHVYKIESENKYVSTSIKEWKCKSIEIDKNGSIAINIILTSKYSKIVSEEEFKEAYKSTMNHIVLEGFLQASEPATEEEIRESIYDDEPVSNMELCDALNDEE